MMSVTDVKVKLNNDIVPLIRNGDKFSRDITSPSISNDYDMRVMAYDEAGNITVATSTQFPMLNLTVTKWKTPKIDWILKDRLNIHDYNRIKNNLEFLHELASNLNVPFNIEEMGADKTYTDWFYADEFNLFEENLDIINQFIFTQKIGARKEFFEEAPFIDYEELNRLENACLIIYNLLYGQKKNKQRLSFRLRNFKGVRL